MRYWRIALLVVLLLLIAFFIPERNKQPLPVLPTTTPVQKSVMETPVRPGPPPARTGVAVQTNSLCTVEIGFRPFDRTKHRLTFYRDAEYPALIKVDGVHHSGVDGSIPDEEIEFFHIKHAGKVFEVPHSVYRSLFEPHFGSRYVNSAFQFQSDAETITVTFSGGDGAGSYEAKFVINLETGKGTRYLNEFPDFERAKIKRFKLVEQR
ncbi:MAG: hypothetical protein HY774_19750 [Acidobacteria bacterium]|nr:hypothetical protein [Acidobacteriota bacterium]